MKKYVVLVVFIITLVIFSSLLFGDTFAKYVSSYSGDSSFGVAFPVIVDTYNEISIPLTEMKPGDTFTYPFYVTNQEASTFKISEVDINYYFEISYSNNLPASFEIIKGDVDANILDENDKSPEYTLNHSIVQSHNYSLKVVWDNAYDSFEWRNLIEEVTLRLYSYQANS